MFGATMSNSTCLSEDTSVSSGTRVQPDFSCLNPLLSTFSDIHNPTLKLKKKRSLPGNPDPDAEVIALSPKTLLATNRFVCEICNKGFQRDQNLQLHRRGHNLPWKLKQRNNKELVRKKAYVCPEPTCVHHHPSRALGDLTGIKKHFCRKHGEKKWKCDKCSKVYAVQSDWKAHSKTCGTREYRCDCGTLFSRKDSFITHRAFCDALAEESARLSANQLIMSANAASSGTVITDLNTSSITPAHSLFPFSSHHQFSNSPLSLPLSPPPQTRMSLNPWEHIQNPNPSNTIQIIKPEDSHSHSHSLSHYRSFCQIPTLPLSNSTSTNITNNPFSLIQDHQQHKVGSSSTSFPMITSPFRNLHMSVQSAANAATSSHLSATALLQKAATVGAGAAKSNHQRPESVGHMTHFNMPSIAEFGAPNHVDSLTHRFGPDFSTWSKSDRLTRDFLGLTEESNGGGGSGVNGGVQVNMGVKEMLTYAGGLEMFKPHHNNNDHDFGYAEPTSNETWEC